MSGLEEILAELRAIPMRQQQEPEETAACCRGDRAGYEWHHRTKNLPACPESHEANLAYNREYLREWRKRRPTYHREWKANRRAGGAS